MTRKDAPVAGEEYLLVGGSKDKCIANGHSWEESKVKKRYLVLVSDLVARRVYVEASSEEEALEAAGYGEWEIPADVESEEVVDRQAEEVIDVED